MGNIVHYTYRIIRRPDKRLAVYKCLISDSQTYWEEPPIIDVISDEEDSPEVLINHLQSIIDVISGEEIVNADPSFQDWTISIDEEEDYYDEG